MNLKKYSPLVLRTAISIIFLWFGFSQIKDPAKWIGMLPDYVTNSISLAPTNLVYINGIFEIVLGSFLLLGLFTRVTSGILALHLLHITSIVGYGAIGARDLALTIATLAIFFQGADEFCLDNILKERKEKQEKI